MIAITPAALEVLAAAQAAAVRFNPDARLRVARSSSGVTFELADEAGPGDQEVRAGSLVLLVETGLVGTVDVLEHGVLTLLPA